MRKYTMLVSVIAHAGAVVVLFLAPLFAADILPELRDRTQWTPVVAAALPPSPPAPGRKPPKVPDRAAPTQAPEGVSPEEPVTGTSSGVPEFNETEGIGNGGFFGTAAGVGDGPGLPPPAPPPPAPPAPVPVGGAVQPPKKIFDVAPVYPTLAVQARREGRVLLEAVIAEDGSVRDVRVLRSIPLLDAAAIEAVRQWRFTPTRLNGQPVPVLMTVTVTFLLNR